MRLARYPLILLLILVSGKIYGQNVTSWREKTIPVTGDTIQLDTLSIVYGTFTAYHGNEKLDSTQYTLNSASAQLILAPVTPHDSLRVRYAVFPFLLAKTYSHKNQQDYTVNPGSRINPFLYRPGDKQQVNDPFATGSLNKSGSLSRGISFGNNRDVAVNSSLNLQLSGKITDDVELTMAATDDNLPIQPDGTTAQLQEFDRVYIQLSGKGTKLVAGDFFLTRPNSYFMNFNKRGQGLSVTTTQPAGPQKPKEPRTVYVAASAAISKGKFARNIFQGVEGNQGPYRLHGAENELFIVVLSGTEKVYLDGKLLERGQENDYVIDYNTAQITFTAKQLITKDKRIEVEFQYSDRNYSRSLVYAGVEYKRNGFEIRLHAYSEQDNKNQPLQQTLTLEDKQLLAYVGDTLSQAFVPGVDSVAFSGDLVLYKKTDSLVNSILYQDIYVYSTSPDSAHYRLSFTYVGFNGGNYVQVTSSGNGKTFKWVAPVSGIPQGDYEPVILLITPKRRQMVSLGVKKTTTLGLFDVEFAYTDNDINTFSPYNSFDDHGAGGHASFENEYRVADSLKMHLLTRYELTSRYFTPLERYRPVEFERDWNLGWGNVNRLPTADQHLANVQLGLKKTNSLNGLLYEYSMFHEGTFYNGVKNHLGGYWSLSGFLLNANVSVLHSSGESLSTDFVRQNAGISKRLGRSVVVRITESQEINRLVRPGNPQLLASSAGFFEWEASVTVADTAKRSFTLFYKQRHDDLPSSENLQRATFAENFGGTLSLNKNPNQSIRLTAAWRKLTITSPLLTPQAPDNTLVGRLEYNLRAWKGVLALSTFYETGSGLEVKKEYTYIEVPAGQGNFTWTDYNEDGVKQLNEFENALYADQASYIRVFTPTNQYVKVYTNQFSQSVHIRPGIKWANKKGLRGFAGRFSDAVVYRVDRKTMSRAPEDAFLPLPDDSRDTALVSLSATIRNTIIFNQLSSKFGLEYTWQDVRGKNLLTNGIESRSNTYNELHARWNMTRAFSLVTLYRDGTKSNSSEFFSSRNYRIRYFETEPKFSYQPGSTFRVSLLYRYSVKRNSPDQGGESAILQKFGTEVKISKLSKGSLDAEFNYYRIDYTGIVSSSVGYDMLEGLKPGENFTWRLSWQRSLAANLQLTIGYEGRKTPGNYTIHSGSAQVRAIF
jgi:hypothetical protein